MSNAKDFDCATCDHRYCGEGIKGSNGIAPFPKWKLDGVGTMNSCPLPMITEESDFFLSMHVHYRNGNLLIKGGLLDQPNKYLEAMELIG